MKAAALFFLFLACGTTPLEPFEDRLRPGSVECRSLESEVVRPSDPLDRIRQFRNQELFFKKCVAKGSFGDETQEPSTDDDPSS